MPFCYLTNVFLETFRCRKVWEQVCLDSILAAKRKLKKNILVTYIYNVQFFYCVVHLQDKVTPSTKALWPGASFQNRSY
jgi:hypothetical protein